MVPFNELGFKMNRIFRTSRIYRRIHMNSFYRNCFLAYGVLQDTTTLISGDLRDLLESGLHKEFPEVLFECALDRLYCVCSPAFEAVIGSPLPKHLDPFQQAVEVLSSRLETFRHLLSWFRLVQTNAETLAPYLSHDPIRFRVSVLGALFTPEIYRSLQPYIFAYLLLELNSAEAQQPALNCFQGSNQTSELVASISAVCPVDDLLLACREVFETQGFCLRFLLKDFILPLAESAFLHKTRELIEGCFSRSFLDSLRAYERCVMQGVWWVRVGREGVQPLPLPSWSGEKNRLVNETFYAVRRPEIFNIMMDYPDSHPTVVDLKAYLMETRSLQDLIDNLSKEVNTRLLNAGVHTDEVLFAYGCLVRGLRELDPSSVAQDIVCRPVAACLREREDAVRCIVDRLITPPAPPAPGGNVSTPIGASGGGGGSGIDAVAGLQNELLLPTPLDVEPVDDARDCDAHLVAHDPDECFPLNVLSTEPEETAAMNFSTSSNQCTGGESENICASPQEQLVVNADWDRWMPDPLEALHHTTGPPWKRRIDLLSLLVGIYGSKKSFMVEYRNLLSQRLLRQLSYDVTAQQKHLEQLKQRFGETELLECEIMLKDISDSRKANEFVEKKLAADAKNHKELPKGVDYPLQAYVLSSEYWPEFKREEFKIPEGLMGPFDRYLKAFQKYKIQRTLKWLTKLGLVNITLDLHSGQSVTMSVSPLQASILHLFTLQTRWSLCDIGQKLEITTSAVRRSLQPFVQRGILEQTVGDIETYKVCTSAKYKCAGQGNINVSVFEDEGPQEMETLPTKEQNGSDPQVFWTYLRGMLSNLGGMTTERVFAMMRMLALGSSGVVECSRPQLKQFLEKKVRLGELIFEDNMYKLVKK